MTIQQKFSKKKKKTKQTSVVDVLVEHLGFLSIVFSSVIIVAHSSLLIVPLHATFPCHQHTALTFQVFTNLHQL